MRGAPIIEKIESIKAFRQVDGALALADVGNLLKAAPAAFVSPTGERAGESRLVGGHDQRVDATFAVIIVIAAAARQAGQPADTLHDLATAVRDTLTAWTHPDMASATEYAGGKLLAMSGGYLFWQMDFRTRYHFRKV